ncbi:MAG TPA: zinc-binding dehydrogenase [Rubrobacteraceae bacterium]|nr:zinc-binding dehydrogenase [Rubrobacteraceae bacterium]
MRAMVTPEFGGPDLFEEQDLQRPEAGPGEVVVRVVVAGTNPVDAKLRAGDIPGAVETPVVLGADVSGVVEEVGAGVTDLKPGDEVYYSPELFGPVSNGSYAEFNLVPAAIVAPKPSSISHEEAAAVPLAGGTAWEAIVRRLGVVPGETVLIHGGAGGVGSFAVQIARAAGARVIATAGSSNQETLRELGADVCLDYSSDDVAGTASAENGGEGVDAVFDTVGGQVEEATGYTRPFGRIATILPPQGDLTQLYLKNQTLYGVFLTRERRRLVELARLMDRGQVKPLVDEVLDLSEVGKAHERLESGHGRGKVVLRVSRG